MEGTLSIDQNVTSALQYSQAAQYTGFQATGTQCGAGIFQLAGLKSKTMVQLLGAGSLENCLRFGLSLNYRIH